MRRKKLAEFEGAPDGAPFVCLDGDRNFSPASAGGRPAWLRRTLCILARLLYSDAPAPGFGAPLGKNSFFTRVLARRKFT